MKVAPLINLDDERITIGAIVRAGIEGLNDELTRAFHTVTVADFVDPNHIVIFDLAFGLFHRHGLLDTNLVMSELARKGHSGKIADALTAAIESVPTGYLLPVYAQRLHEAAAQRNAADLLTKTLSAINEGRTIDLRAIGNRIGELASTCSGVEIVKLVDVEARDIAWLWQGRIARGCITLLSSMPGVGKTMLSADIGSRITTAYGWPDGSPTCESGDVVLMNAEDDPHTVLRPRFEAHGADLSRVHLLQPAQSAKADQVITLADVHLIEQTVKQLPEARALFVDPIGSFMGGKVDADKDNKVRAVLRPIAALAQRYNIAVILIAHRRKSAGTFADDSILGSRAFTGIARNVWHLTRDEHDDERRLLLSGKGNLCGKIGGLAFRIESYQKSAVVRWEESPVDTTADAAFAAEQDRHKPGPKPEQTEKAVVYLKQALAEGPRLTRDVEEEAAQMHGIKKATLTAAREVAGVEAFRQVNPGPWFLRLKSQKTALSGTSTTSAASAPSAPSAHRT